MYSDFSYPIICTKDYVKTVNFYEDYLNYSPVFELESYVVLKRNDWNNSYLAVIDTTHPNIPAQYQRQVSGMMLTHPVLNVQAARDQFYFEGVQIITSPDACLSIKDQFLIEDPNGVLIMVVDNVTPKLSHDNSMLIFQSVQELVDA